MHRHVQREDVRSAADGDALAFPSDDHRRSPEKPHVDVLHPARRLWRHRSGIEPEGCNLRFWSAISSASGGRRRSRASKSRRAISGFFEPAIRRRSKTVLEHNRLDLVSLAVVTARAPTIAHGGSPACRDGRERVALGRLFERAGRRSTRRSSATATQRRADAGVSADGWCRLASDLRRARRYAEAADAWRQVLASASSGSTGALARHALAVHMEHRTGDLDGARTVALEALFDLESNSLPRRCEDAAVQAGPAGQENRPKTRSARGRRLRAVLKCVGLLLPQLQHAERFPAPLEKHHPQTGRSAIGDQLEPESVSIKDDRPIEVGHAHLHVSAATPERAGLAFHTGMRITGGRAQVVSAA